MFCKSLKFREGIVLVANKEGISNTSIHMFFVFFPIDIIWLDKNLRIVDYKQNVKPFTFLVNPNKPAKYVLELPKKSIKNINFGDQLVFKK